MKNRMLALLVISAFSTGASAAVVTVDAGNYSVSYDEAFWGVGSFSQSGQVITFSNLVNNFGASTTAATSHPNSIQSNTFHALDAWIPAIVVTADSGYKIKSVLGGGTGSLDGEAGLDPLNTKGSSAFADVTVETSWYKDDSYSFQSYEGWTTARKYFARGINSLGEEDNVVGMPGTFNDAMLRNFSDNLTSVIGRFRASGSVSVSGKGSWATAQFDSAYFSFDVVPIAPIPEPETWVMFLGGLGMMCVVARRRKSAAV